MRSADSAQARRLEDSARRHLWLHYTRHGQFEDSPMPIIASAKGVYIEDISGQRYLDGLSGLFVVQVGYGRPELVAAASQQSATLSYYPIWNYAHPAAVRLAEQLAQLAPGELNRVFFTTGGGEAIESAIKLARQYFRTIGKPYKSKIISRAGAFHGSSMGAISLAGVSSIREPFQPLLPGVLRASSMLRDTCLSCRSQRGCTLDCATDIERIIQNEDPETIAAVVLEPVQNSGGTIPPPPGYFDRVRQICDRYDVLLVSDEVICGFGRLGQMFGCERFGFTPDMIACAKGLTSGYAPLGALIVSDRLFEPFATGEEIFEHGYTFAGHPLSTAVGLANLAVFEADEVLAHVRAQEPEFRARLERLTELPIVSGIRGAGYQQSIVLARDKVTGADFSEEEAKLILRDFLSRELQRAGLLCRADNDGSFITLAPPLICGPAEFDEITEIIGNVLVATWDRLGK
jgi:adenosylmethionine-8-amino-7-oxononanoate aminotransferase